MSQERFIVNICLQDEQLYEYAFSTYNQFTITGNEDLVCENVSTDFRRPHKCLDIQVNDNKPTQENIMKFLSFAPICNLTHLDYTELVGEHYFFPKIDAILDYLKDRCPKLRSLYVKFEKNPDVPKLYSHYLFKVVNYKKLEVLIIKMSLEKKYTVQLIEYEAGDCLNVNGGLIKRLNSDSLFNWDETNHKPVEKLNLYECSFFHKLDIIYLFNLFKKNLLYFNLDLVLPDIFFLYLDWCSCLESLNIIFKTWDSIDDLMGIAYLRVLRELTFENLNIAARPLVMKLFNHINMATLQLLQFNKCPCINDSILKIISNTCFALENIDIISWCEISDFGIMSILCNCQSLTELKLDSICGIEGYFLTFTSKLYPQLQNVRIVNCSIKNPVCQDLNDKHVAEYDLYSDERDIDLILEMDD